MSGFRPPLQLIKYNRNSSSSNSAESSSNTSEFRHPLVIKYDWISSSNVNATLQPETVNSSSILSNVYVIAAIASAVLAVCIAVLLLIFKRCFPQRFNRLMRLLFCFRRNKQELLRNELPPNSVELLSLRIREELVNLPAAERVALIEEEEIAIQFEVAKKHKPLKPQLVESQFHEPAEVVKKIVPLLQITVEEKVETIQFEDAVKVQHEVAKVQEALEPQPVESQLHEPAEVVKKVVLIFHMAVEEEEETIEFEELHEPSEVVQQIANVREAAEEVHEDQEYAKSEDDDYKVGAAVQQAEHLAAQLIKEALLDVKRVADARKAAAEQVHEDQECETAEDDGNAGVAERVQPRSANEEVAIKLVEKMLEAVVRRPKAKKVDKNSECEELKDDDDDGNAGVAERMQPQLEDEEVVKAVVEGMVDVVVREAEAEEVDESSDYEELDDDDAGDAGVAALMLHPPVVDEGLHGPDDVVVAEVVVHGEAESPDDSEIEKSEEDSDKGIIRCP